jgi:hypothetical protein
MQHTLAVSGMHVEIRKDFVCFLCSLLALSSQPDRLGLAVAAIVSCGLFQRCFIIKGP